MENRGEYGFGPVLRKGFAGLVQDVQGPADEDHVIGTRQLQRDAGGGVGVGVPVHVLAVSHGEPRQVPGRHGPGHVALRRDEHAGAPGDLGHAVGGVLVRAHAHDGDDAAAGEVLIQRPGHGIGAVGVVPAVQQDQGLPADDLQPAGINKVSAIFIFYM